MTSPMNVAAAIEYQPGGIVSRQLMKKPAGNLTLFALDEGQELTEHTSPFDALLHVIDGEAEVSIAGEPHRVLAGEMMLLAATRPHAVKAPTRFKMILTMIRA